MESRAIQRDVEAYFVEGCGRCEHFNTPQCKVHLWTEPLALLRAMLKATELTETMRWGSPCYALDGKNVLMITSFREYCALSFFKGVLLDDPEGHLSSPGPNSRVMRLMRFTSAEEVEANRAAAEAFIAEAIAIEAEGRKVELAPDPEPMPEELQAVLDDDPRVAEAYGNLTPGRRRSYVLHVGGAKKAETRQSRAERCVAKILTGKGFNER